MADPAVQAFSNVLRQNYTDTQIVISRLVSSFNQRLELDHSSKRVSTLDPASLRFPDGSQVPTNPRVARGTKAILTARGTSYNVTYIGGGTYGEIWQSDTKDTFKRVVPQADKSFEELARNFLCECWIQTILNNDPRYGEATSQILEIYKDESIVSSIGRTARIAIAGTPIFFIKMEYIPYTLGAIVEKDRLTLKQTRGILYKIAQYLEHFGNEYGFYHNDLHVGNIMLSEKSVKIIDFGMSCITYNRVSYGMPRDVAVYFGPRDARGVPIPKMCYSLDLLILLVSLREQVKSSTVSGFLDTLLTTPSGRNVFQKLQSITPANKAVFHMTYWWELDTLPRNIQAYIMLLPAVSPEGLQILLTGEYDRDSVTGLRLSTVFPVLKTVKNALGLKASPESNVESAISTLRSIKGGKRTRKQKRKGKHTRKH